MRRLHVANNRSCHKFTRLHCQNGGSELKWRMSAGLWQRYSPDGDLVVSYNGARLFDTPKDGVIKQINIYSTQVCEIRPAAQAKSGMQRITAWD